MIQLENFDDLFIGHPQEIEKNMTALLPEARARADKSIYLQLLSQIALTQAMQKKFTEAHATLDSAEEGLTSEYPLARVRILLERGRLFHQAGELTKALPLFIQSYEASAAHGFDFHTINAAHMVPLAVHDVAEKILWNERAIAIAEACSDVRARSWLGALYNNIAQNYVEANLFDKALHAFEQCKIQAEERGDPIVIRGSKWGAGRALRGLNRLEEASVIQHALLAEYRQIAEEHSLPYEVMIVGRGMVYEELAEIGGADAKHYAVLAYADLSQNEWFQRLAANRLQRLKQLSTL